MQRNFAVPVQFTPYDFAHGLARGQASAAFLIGTAAVAITVWDRGELVERWDYVLGRVLRDEFLCRYEWRQATGEGPRT